MSKLLKFLSVIFLISFLALGLYIMSEYGQIEQISYQSSYLSGYNTTKTVDNPIAYIVGVGLILQGLFTFATGYGTAIIIDNTKQINAKLDSKSENNE